MWKKMHAFLMAEEAVARVPIDTFYSSCTDRDRCTSQDFLRLLEWKIGDVVVVRFSGMGQNKRTIVSTRARQSSLCLRNDYVVW